MPTIFITALAGLAALISAVLWYRTPYPRGPSWVLHCWGRRSGLDVTIGGRQLRFYRYFNPSYFESMRPGFARDPFTAVAFAQCRSKHDTRYLWLAGFCALAGRNQDSGRRYWAVAIPLWFFIVAAVLVAAIGMVRLTPH